MNKKLEPLVSKSLKEVFVEEFSRMILSGEYHIGERLPSERDLAKRLRVSRPVVHEGLVYLASLGMVTMQPRRGTIVNDYRTTGSITLLNTLIQYSEGALDKSFLFSMLQMRKLLEIENAVLAAQNRTEDHLAVLKSIIQQEKNLNISNVDRIVSIDFEFHHQIAIATGNLVYPLLLNSFQLVYTNLTRRFFRNQIIVNEVFDFHQQLLKAIEEQNTKDSEKIMTAMLGHGEKQLVSYIENKGE